MDLYLKRFEKTPTYTVGLLEIANIFQCFTIEDAERDVKIAGKTCIPCGRYEVTITPSPRFKRKMMLINNVPNFQGIRIHTGNNNNETEGCLLPNLVYAGNGNGLYSLNAVDIIFEIVQAEILRGEKVFIEIISQEILI